MVESSLPLYRQIADKMKKEISSQNWKIGEAIPTEAKLSDWFEASRVTIRQAINVLVKEGLLYKVQGSGTYVKENKIEHDIFTLKGFSEEMHSLGKITDNKVLQFSMQYPDERIREILDLKEGEKTFYVRRQRWVEEIPLVVEDTYLPVKLFPTLSYEIMQKSKYDFIEKEIKLSIKESFQEVIPILPDKEIQELLHLKELTPIIKVQSWSSLSDNTIFEYTDVYFNSSHYKFSLTASRSRG